MQQAGVVVDTDFGTELWRNINRKSYQNTWSPSGRNFSIIHTTAGDRRPSLADLEKICSHLAVSPNRLRAAACFASGTNKSYVGQSVMSPSKLCTLNEEQLMSKNSKRRRDSSAAQQSTYAPKGNHLPKVGKSNQTASTNCTAETLPNTSTCYSDDNSSAKSSATTTTTNSKPKKSIRKFIVTPATEPL